MRVYWKTQPVAGLPGMPFVPVYRPGLIWPPRFKSAPGLRQFIIWRSNGKDVWDDSDPKH
jgi:hypothetical protein